MSKRFTVTEKWEDSWFWQLKPYEKLLWNYLCDKCDLAGFWEINLELATVQTKIPKTAISGAVQGLSRGYITNGKYVWLRNFIHHQGNYPLNPNNNAHRHIIKLIERHSDFDNVNFFELLETVNSGATEGLISPPSKGKGNSKGKSYSEDFLNFWEKYPKRYIRESGRYVKVGKHLAWEQWEKLDEDTHRHILSIISQMKSGTAVPDAWRWLRDKKFEDYTLAKPKPTEKDKAAELKAERQKIRDENEEYLRSKTTPALKDLLEDKKGHLYGLCHWLIKEILDKRQSKGD